MAITNRLKLIFLYILIVLLIVVLFLFFSFLYPEYDFLINNNNRYLLEILSELTHCSSIGDSVNGWVIYLMIIDHT